MVIWLIIILSNILFIFGVYTQIIKDKSFGNNPADDTTLLIAVIAIFLISISFYFFRLDTLVKEDGIYVRLFPFHFTYRYYPWEKILKIYLRKYSPIGEYGGWGIRYGFGSKGKAFNVSGNMGLQLEFKDQKKLLIGTNQPEELRESLKRIGILN